MQRQIYLIKVEPNVNSNKFYLMEQAEGSSTFKATWGRVGNSGTSKIYSAREWDKKYNEKISKGYTDMSEIKSVECEEDKNARISDPIIAELFDMLQYFANQTIKRNYTIALGVVTPQMISSGQTLIDRLFELNKEPNCSIDEFNDVLLDLFKVIPRSMNLVKNFLAKNRDEFSDIYVREQKLFNTLKVSAKIQPSNVISNEKKRTIIEELGLKVENVSPIEMDFIKSQLDNRVPVDPKRAWKIINEKTQAKFDKYCKENNISEKDTKLLWHGSGNENWLSILNLGLLIRPSFASYTGSMFGDGLYFAPKASKSWGYTSHKSACWKNGASETAFMGLFETAYGKPLCVNSCGFYDSKYVKSKKCNCVHAYAGVSGLRNEEIIFYNTDQVTIKYLVEF